MMILRVSVGWSLSFYPEGLTFLLEFEVSTTGES